MDDLTTGPLTYQVVRETWLTQKPAPRAAYWALGSAVALGLGSLAYWGGGAPWIPATGQAVFSEHQYWRLWTTVFAHADLFHLLGNAMLFIFLGYFLNGYFGAYAFPFMAFVYGGVINAASLLTYPPGLTLIGASGVVSWLGGAWLTLYLLLNTQKSPTQRALRAGGVALAVFAPAETFDPHISYRTHVIGFGLGVLWAGVYFLRRRRVFSSAVRLETVIEEDDVPPEVEVSDDALRP